MPRFTSTASTFTGGPYLSTTSTLPTSTTGVAATTITDNINSRLNVVKVTKTTATNYQIDYFSNVTSLASPPSVPDATQTYTVPDTTNLRIGFYADAFGVGDVFGYDI